MSGTRAPEIQQELDQEEAAERQNAEIQMRRLSEYNQKRGYDTAVTLKITYDSGFWYLELADAMDRQVKFSNRDLSVALEEIFR